MVKTDRAATFIELIVTMLVITVIATASIAFFTPLLNLFFYSPSQLMVDETAQELLSIIIEGDNRAKGLRFAQSVTEADEDEIRFVTWDDDTVDYRWDSSAERLYRDINSQGEELIPDSYYGDITVVGQDSDEEIFQYYDSSASKLSVPVSDETDIESIRMELILRAGSGDVKEHKGIVYVKSGVDVKQFD